MSFNNSVENIIPLALFPGFIFLKLCNLAILYSNNGNMQRRQDCCVYFVFKIATFCVHFY